MRISPASCEFVNHVCAVAAIGLLARAIDIETTAATRSAAALLLLVAGYRYWDHHTGPSPSSIKHIALDAGLGMAAAEILIFWF